MKDSLDILLTEPVYVAHDSLDILNPDVICHHGILGMKWGIRRYQNKDGSLTWKGKQRYYKNPVSSGIHATELTDKGKKALQNKDGSWKDTPAGQYAKQEHEKNMSQHEADTKIVRELEPGLEKMQGLKTPSEQWRKDPKTSKEWDDAANLGLKAMEKLDLLNYREPSEKGKPFDNDEKFWFLCEDQTIGLAETAAMINRGYKPTEIKELAEKANKLYYGELPESKNSFMEAFVFASNEWQGNDDYLNACYKLKQSK